MECSVSFTDCEQYTLRIQGLCTITLCDNHVTHAHRHIQCNPMTIYMHNKYDKHDNKHVKYILCVICSIHFNPVNITYILITNI
jgi:hypothetical protein